MDVLHLIFLGVAAACAGLAWGYRGQRDIQREQVTFLRAQGGYKEPPAQDRPQPKALAPLRGGI
jgi:hypothetical protein